jgi:hypothetical protein
MQDRITRRLVTFLHPFSLGGVEGEQPAGTYEIETVEAPIDCLSFLAYRRVSTTMDLPSNLAAMRARQRVDIDPRDLEAVEKRDAAMPAAVSAMRVGTMTHRAIDPDRRRVRRSSRERTEPGS